MTDADDAPLDEIDALDDDNDDLDDDDLDDEDDDDDFDDDEDDDDDFDDEDDNVGNRIIGGTPRAVLTYVARMIVDDPDGVVVEVDENRRGVMLRLHVAQGDMGKVIGRHGRVARAIRTLVRAAGEREGISAQVDIVD